MSKKYYFVDALWRVDSFDANADYNWAKAMKEVGNCFDTPEEAQAVANQLREQFKKR